MQKEFEASKEEPVKLLTTAEVAEILRVSRRTVEEIGKKFERAKADVLPGELPPSCPRYGLRRTPVTKRKQFFNQSDIREFLVNCRRESDGLEPIRLGADDDGERGIGRSKSQGTPRV